MLGHGLYPSGTIQSVKNQLLKHIVLRKCVDHDIKHPLAACCAVMDQRIPAIGGADRTAFILAIACLNPETTCNTLNLVLSLVTGRAHHAESHSSAHSALHQHVYNLSRGRSVYHSLVQASHHKHHFTLLNQVQNTWPAVADPALNDRIKSLFETEITT